jgi:hypothetical protein
MMLRAPRGDGAPFSLALAGWQTGDGGSHIPSWRDGTRFLFHKTSPCAYWVPYLVDGSHLVSVNGPILATVC